MKRNQTQNKIGTTVATSTPCTQILVSNAVLHKRDPGLCGEMADSRTGAGNMQGDPGESSNARK